jgi:ribonucleoside-diphosphate reductase beta chain
MPYSVDDHPLPWLAPLLNGVEHANFFETRATEYSKAATRGDWQDVWSSFDQRRNAKASAANEVGESEGPGLFGDDASAGAAAE